MTAEIINFAEPKKVCSMCGKEIGKNEKYAAFAPPLLICKQCIEKCQKLIDAE